MQLIRRYALSHCGNKARIPSRHSFYGARFSKHHSTHTRNPAGIYLLQEDIRKATFGPKVAPPQKNGNKAEPLNGELNDELREAALQHLANNSLLGQETIKPSKLDVVLPKLLGSSDLDEHFQKIGRHMSDPYLRMCKDYIKNSEKSKIDLHDMNFVAKSGWIRYSAQSVPEPVDFPVEDVITFDTEVLYKLNSFAVMATAVSSSSLYVWLSPWLLGETEEVAQLIPLGTHRQVVIGHYVGFDRKRVKEEYNIDASNKWFMDTMGFHIATNGMCNQQRPSHVLYEKLLAQSQSSDKFEASLSQRKLSAMLKQEPWLTKTAANGLSDVAKFHLGKTMDKSDRNFFGELTREEASEGTMLERLIKYCATDSINTQELFSVLLPKYLSLNPHPVSFGALRHISSVFLPITEDWNTYVETAEAYYGEVQNTINGRLQSLAEEAAAYVDNPQELETGLADPWLAQLDWTVKPIKYTKARKGHPSRPVKNQKMPGRPQWYKELFINTASSEMNLSTRSRTTTMLLRLMWDKYPLVWYDKHGWSFWATRKDKAHYLALNLPHIEDEGEMSLFKLPHPDGADGRCTSPLAKFYFQFFEDGTLKSENKLAMEAISMNIECSYWISCRQRIFDQMPVYQDESRDIKMNLPSGWGIILPRMAPIGAVTRRAVEDTWLTASNAKKNRIGSELKCNVKAPPGYKVVGADVDSEELWIAGVVGDSALKMHGGTAVGWMTLEGTKNAGTDLHSKSAQILGISRNEAKVFNYGRIYGAGKSSAARKLRQFNPSISVAEAERKATALYDSTKGQKSSSKHFVLSKYWRGGTESVLYNQLELLAEQLRQRTPVLGAGISDALSAENLRKNSYMTTRTNWSIQSSGVDYLHLIIAAMHYLCDVYHIQARLLITVHDEVRYLAKEEDSYRTGLALQVANLWTRAMFCQQLGFNDLPQSIAFFSSVDFDHVLRKEVNDPCVTPTQPEAIDYGESLSMVQLTQKCSTLGPIDEVRRAEYDAQIFEPRVPVMMTTNKSPLHLDFVKAQLGTAEVAKRIERRLDASTSREGRKPAKRKTASNSANDITRTGARAQCRVSLIR